MLLTPMLYWTLQGVPQGEISTWLWVANLVQVSTTVSAIKILSALTLNNNN